MMYFGAIYYFSPRLLGTRRMWSESLGIWSAWIMNATLVAGFIGIMTLGEHHALHHLQVAKGERMHGTH